MLLLKLTCPHCQALLTDGEHLVLDALVLDTSEHGRIVLSAVIGEHTIATDLHVPEGAEVEFRCPACEASLNLETRCKLCGARMVSLQVEAREAMEFCSRRGCRAHSIGGHSDIDTMIGLLNRILDTPYD